MSDARVTCFRYGIKHHCYVAHLNFYADMIHIIRQFYSLSYYDLTQSISQTLFVSMAKFKILTVIWFKIILALMSLYGNTGLKLVFLHSTVSDDRQRYTLKVAYSQEWVTVGLWKKKIFQVNCIWCEYFFAVSPYIWVFFFRDAPDRTRTNSDYIHYTYGRKVKNKFDCLWRHITVKLAT